MLSVSDSHTIHQHKHIHHLHKHLEITSKMKVGPRLVFVVLIIAICIGIKDNLWQSFYETFLVLNGINWLLKLVSKKNEIVIMSKILSCEKKVEKLAMSMIDCIMMSVLFIRSLFRGKPFPPILDV